MRYRSTENLNSMYSVRLVPAGTKAVLYLYPCAERKSERVVVGF